MNAHLPPLRERGPRLSDNAAETATGRSSCIQKKSFLTQGEGGGKDELRIGSTLESFYGGEETGDHVAQG